MADYSKGFKRRVVQLWIQHGLSTNEISRTSGIDHKTLMKWYKRFYPEITGGGKRDKVQGFKMALYRQLCRIS